NPSYKYQTTDSTLAFWELNEGSGTTINCSNPDYNGILYNGTWSKNIYQPFDYGSVSDIDGNTYKTIQIGDQIWMAENLKVSKLNDGTPILFGDRDLNWDGVYTIKDAVYTWYNNSISNKEVYGGLYNWYAVNTNKLCPSGWHVPSDDEWKTLENYLGGYLVAGGKLKQTGSIYWQIPNWGATNTTGFTSLPGGIRVEKTFTGIGNYGQYWSSTPNGDNPPGAIYRQTHFQGELLERNTNFKVYGISVRCLKDEVKSISAPTIGTISQPTCTVSTGSVVLSVLPQTGTWTVTATGGSTKSGTGSTTTFTGLAAGTYTFTVTNSEGLTSSASSSAVINAQPVSPSAPVVGTVTQPTTTVSTGSVALSGLPQTGTWTVTATGGSTKSGTGSTTTFTGLSAGTYTFTVTNSNGCTSAATASSTTINAAPTTLTNGLVVYYPFNGNANDTSGNANNGLVTRATLTTDRFGTANTAYSFDGSSTSIKIPFSSSINSIQKGLTVSAWIYMQGGTPAGNPPRLLELRGAYGNGGNAGFVLLSQGNSDSARTFETRWYNNNGATNISIAPTSSVTSKEWHHVVFTADGESAVGKFYVDGILRGTNAQMQNQGKITSCDYNSNAIFIGIEPGGTGAWGGKIDELRIYNRALDSNEVLYAFNAQNNIEPSNLKVGDSYGGGIIAYLLQPGDSGYSATVPHGIIVPPTDQGRLTYPWGCSGTLIGEISTNWGTGKTNTNKILAKCTATNTAAKLCDDLVLNGYTDWFLPSLGDLQKIRNLHQSGKGSFSTDLSYFTSSEVNAEVTYEYYISSGATGQVAKTLNLCVRAARYF
ncbi:MAG: hypothetical protein RLZ76_1647, partial [Bacteroidota bacterium]